MSKHKVDFGYITASNPSFNTYWEVGTKIQEMAKNVSPNPRLYANGWNYFYPGTDAQSNDDLPEWVVIAYPSLTTAGLPGSRAKVYLQLWVGDGNFYCVAQIAAKIDQNINIGDAIAALK